MLEHLDNLATEALAMTLLFAVAAVILGIVVLILRHTTNKSIKEWLTRVLDEEAENAAKCPECGSPCLHIDEEGIWAGKTLTEAHSEATNKFIINPKEPYSCFKCNHNWRDIK